MINGLENEKLLRLTSSQKNEISTAIGEIMSGDSDRKGFSPQEIRSIARIQASSYTDAELTQAVQQLERFLVITSTSQLQDYSRTYSPEQEFALGVVEAAIKRGIKFNTVGLKLVAAEEGRNNIDDIDYLTSHGYKIVDEKLAELGFPTVKTAVKNVNQIAATTPTIVENQKLALLNEALSGANKIGYKFKIFEAKKGNDKISIVDNEYIAIDREYLKECDFNTLYIQVWSQIAKVTNPMDWGYAMTDMLGTQLQQSSDAIFRAKFNACAQKFAELK